MDTKLRMKMWSDMSEPKPSWETFKRMMPMNNNDPLLVRTKWLKAIRQNASQIGA